MHVLERSKIINKLNESISRNVEELGFIENKDTGLPMYQTQSALIPCATKTKQISVGDPMSTSTKVGALISKQHWIKMTGYIKVGIEGGAKVIASG